MSDLVRVWLDIPKELETALRALGKREHLPRNAVIQRACEEYVARRSTGLHRAESSGDAETPEVRASRGLKTMALVREHA